MDDTPPLGLHSNWSLGGKGGDDGDSGELGRDCCPSTETETNQNWIIECQHAVAPDDRGEIQPTKADEHA